MPKSKHRRKAGEKAVPHPGRGRGSPLQLAWPDERREERPVRRDLHATEENLRGLPLFEAKREPSEGVDHENWPQIRG